MLITNDPYKTAGQLLDVTVLYPVFRDGRVIAFFGSTIHHTDVGGYGIGAGGRDVFEEGLWIPICKLMTAGERNDDVWKFILSNVRQPDHMAGDLHAQMASGEVGAQRLLALCDAARPRRHRGPRRRDHRAAREAATRAIDPRAAGRHVPRRRRCSTSPTAAASTSSCAITVDPMPARSSSTTRARPGASPYGINVVKNYTHAYTTFTVRSRAQPGDPEQPRQPGADQGRGARRQRSSTPSRPQPGTARHVVGMFLPNALLKALAQIKPEQAMAEGSGAVWTMQVSGNHDDGSPFITAMFTYAGGVGARAAKPGLSACSYPTGVAAVPVEVVEASAPDPLPCARQLRAGCGGAGAQTGGLGQTIEFTVDTTRPWQLNAVTSRASRSRRRASSAASPGAAGSFTVNGEAGHDPGPHHPAARRRRPPRAPGRRRLRRRAN